eukprot:CAMPEP_0119275730 /NCGR_PEP_ID=MMETSP1329-20130426/14310_1 /TAXON_ID=114041 /ORGANISM="Genus nov. species nov., Strain RCC1024" /LENGTH=109 /DNA_ID=CAMNT_0007276139 /DNA_START=96 /DNA_END=422 /DNA_ORIENTATION=-
MSSAFHFAVAARPRDASAGRRLNAEEDLTMIGRALVALLILATIVLAVACVAHCTLQCVALFIPGSPAATDLHRLCKVIPNAPPESGDYWNRSWTTQPGSADAADVEAP